MSIQDSSPPEEWGPLKDPFSPQNIISPEKVKEHFTSFPHAAAMKDPQSGRYPLHQAAMQLRVWTKRYKVVSNDEHAGKAFVYVY